MISRETPKAFLLQSLFRTPSFHTIHFCSFSVSSRSAINQSVLGSVCPEESHVTTAIPFSIRYCISHHLSLSLSPVFSSSPLCLTTLSSTSPSILLILFPSHFHTASILLLQCSASHQLRSFPILFHSSLRSPYPFFFFFILSLLLCIATPSILCRSSHCLPSSGVSHLVPCITTLSTTFPSSLGVFFIPLISTLHL